MMDIYIRVSDRLGDVGFSSRAIKGHIGYILDATTVSAETGQKDAKKMQPTKDSDILNRYIVFVPDR